ncbi:MAG: hypothetical protein OCD01_08275 [Fibrobacterales bacterium]
MDQAEIHVIDALDEDWFPNSDGMVDLFSQKGEGVFDPARDPFKTIYINGEALYPVTDASGRVTMRDASVLGQAIHSVPHGDRFGLKGPESYGSVFIKAIEMMPGMPEVHNIIPTIITPLLLN